MSARETGGPAFPLPGELVSKMMAVCDHLPDEQAEKVAEQIGAASCGMHLRDYFAAKAVQGLLAEPFVPGAESTVSVLNGHGVGNQCEVASHYARAAYILADAMLKARES